MDRAVVRVLAGRQQPRAGVVLDRPAPRGKVAVRWSDGRDENVAARDPSLRFVPEASRQLGWLMAPHTLRRDFARDPAAVAAELIRETGEPIATPSLKNALVRLGLDRESVSAVWGRVQVGLRSNPNVEIDGQWHRWLTEPIDRLASVRAMSPVQALDELFSGKRLVAAHKRALIEAVRARIAGPGAEAPGVTTPIAGAPGATTPRAADHSSAAASIDGTSPQADTELARLRADNDRLQSLLRTTHHQQVAFRAAQDRQLKIDVIRALAELAIEVEDLAVNGAEPDIIVERVRALAEMNSLEPIGQVGEATMFDPARHAPLAEYPDPGTAVSVVRPGYTWRTGEGDVLIEKAIVG